MINKGNNGLYQIRRLRIDLRGSGTRESDAEVEINTALLELQQNNNVEILDVVEASPDRSIYTIIIKYLDKNI